MISRLFNQCPLYQVVKAMDVVGVWILDNVRRVLLDYSYITIIVHLLLHYLTRKMHRFVSIYALHFALLWGRELRRGYLVEVI